jgi:plastocyanin
MRKRLAVLGAVLALGLVAAACSSDNGGSTATTTPPAATGATGGGGGTGGTTLTMQNIAYDPTSLSVATGSTITLDNKDSVTHTFTVDGQDVDVTVDGSTTGTATIDLAAGSYDFHCKIHPSMTGTLTVTG